MAVAMAACGAGDVADTTSPPSVTVMAFNVWSADAQTAKLAEIIQAGDADIVGLQEMNNSSGIALANQLGWYYLQQSGGGIQIVSRFPIVESVSGGARFRVSR